MLSKVYRVIVIGPTGSGKSQFCNFVQRDLTNSKNIVSNSLKSCTQEPFSNIFTRLDMNLEFIDSAGSSDSSDNDDKNLEKLVNYLKNKKQIDYILLLLKFGEKLTGETKKYLLDLGKIFTPSEFYYHLCIIFTKYPIKPKKKDIKTRDLFIKEINETLKESFKLDINQELPTIDVRFIDTDIDENDQGELFYDEKSQDTVDIIIKKIKLNSEMYNPINTENLDCTGVSAQKRRVAEIKQLEEKIKKLEEENKRKEEERKEMERLRDLKDQEHQRQYQALVDKMNEERHTRQQYEENERQRKEAITRQQNKIDEEERSKNIQRAELNDKKESFGRLSNFGGKAFLSSLALGIGGALLTPFCPIAGACMIGGAIGGGATGGVEFVGGKIGEYYYENKMNSNK